MLNRLLPIAAALLVTAGCASVPDTTDRAWPVRNADEMATGGNELDVLFPFGRLWEDEGLRDFRVRPFYRRVEDPADGSTDVEILWPIVKVKERPGFRQVRVLPLMFERIMEVEATGKKDRDWILFPFFGGTDSEEGSYFLLFPLVGTTHNLFGSERIWWYLWPIHVQARDREYHSNYILWPLIAWGKGGGKRMFRILPFYGENSNEGKSWRRNFLWPFFSWGEEELNTKYPIRYFFFFPFYGQNRSDAAWQTTVLYPFFMFAGSKRGWREEQILWPIYRHKVHPREWAIRVWPFYAKSEFYNRETGVLQSRQNYWLWPLIWDSEFLVPKGRHEYTLVVPFYRRSRYFSVNGDDRGGDVQIWPLYRSRVAPDGSAVLSVLAPIPFSNWDSFEAAWSWLWTIAEARRSPDGERSQKYLFGLVQWRQGRNGSYTGLTFILEHARDKDDNEKVELLKGLLGWENTKEKGSGIRLLWFIRIPL